MVAELLVLALDYYRAPLRFQHLADVGRPLPREFDKLLSDFCVAVAPQQIARSAEALQADPGELQEAALFFLRQVLLAPGADHYRVLGLSRAASQETVRRHYGLLVRIFHPDRSTGDRLDRDRDAELTARINAAYEVLGSPDARGAYDRQLEAADQGGGKGPDAREFFWPRSPVPAGLEPGGTARGWSLWDRRILLGMALGLAVAVVLGVVFQSARTPVLRSNPELATGVPDGPSFLRGTGRRASEPDEAADPLAERLASLGLSVSEQTEAGIASPAPQADEASPGGAARAAVPPTEVAAAEAGADPVPARQPHRGGSETVVIAAYRPPAEPAAPAQGASAAAVPAQDAAQQRQAPAETAAAKQDAKAPAAPPAGPAPGRTRPVQPPDSEQRDEEPKTARAPEGRVEAPGQPPAPKAPPAAAAEEAAARRAAAEKARAAAEEKARAEAEARRREQATKEQAASAETPRPAPGGPERSDLDPGEAQRLVDRLVSHYRNGNLDGFVGLFTTNARVNDGSGRAFIRSDYENLFSRMRDRRLSIYNLRWRSAGSRGLVGDGKFRVSTRSDPAERWNHAAGTVRLELIPWMGDYRISSMIHSVGGR